MHGKYAHVSITHDMKYIIRMMMMRQTKTKEDFKELLVFYDFFLTSLISAFLTSPT